MSPKSQIKSQIINSVCVISLNNPEKRNVLTIGMLNEISSLFSELSTNSDIRCVVIRGEGGKAFSSGYDISAINNDDMMREFGNDHPLEKCFKAIEDYPYPVIAKINGHVFGAGLELAVTCDIRICAEHIKLGMPPAKLGVVYSYSGTKKFLNLIGTANARELFFTGSPVSAERAVKMGLVNHSVDIIHLHHTVMDIADEIAENAPLSLKTMKQLFNIWERNQTLCKEDENIIKSLFQKVQESEDYREGQIAFEEKRKPVFRGK